jgi:hypothetical protein
MQALAVKCLAVPDFNPIIERDFGFVALVVGFVFMGFDV